MPKALPPTSYLELTLERISQCKEHGTSLVDLILSRQIHERHYPLILGLFTVYTLLESLGHFPASENIFWPPHSDFHREEWLNIGFESEVVDILELLPYIKESIYPNEPIHIAHDAPGLSYLGKANTDYRGNTETGKFLDLKDVFITGDGVGHRYMFGTRHIFYLYRSEDGLLTNALFKIILMFW
jgi:hypothetical protein